MKGGWLAMSCRAFLHHQQQQPAITCRHLGIMHSACCLASSPCLSAAILPHLHTLLTARAHRLLQVGQRDPRVLPHK